MSHAPATIKILICIAIAAIPCTLSAQLGNVLPEDDVEIPPEILEELSLLLEHKLDVNRSPLNPLVETGLLSMEQVAALNAYIAALGPLISIYELQAVPMFDPATIRTVIPYLTVGASAGSGASLKRSVVQTQDEIMLRWKSVLQVPEGYQGGNKAKFEGSRSGMFLRYLRRNDKVSIGLVAESDPGERLFDRGAVVDHISWHISARNITRHIKHIVAGRFEANIGSGLIRQSGFNAGKGVAATRIWRRTSALRPLRSAAENNGLSGVALELEANRHFSITAFASFKKITATLVKDSASDNTIATAITSSGYHRTESERANRRSMHETQTGGTLTYRRKSFRLGLNGLYRNLQSPLMLPERNYNKYYFRGQQQFNSSIEYSFVKQNVTFFGETALDQNGTTAFAHGLIIALDRFIELAIQHRHLPPQYQHQGGSILSENSRSDNEKGLYLGIRLAPVRTVRIDFYNDLWRHPHARFGIDHPSRGNEQFLRITFSKRHKFEAYTQLRREYKQVNGDSRSVITPLVDRTRYNFRIHGSLTIVKGVELRTRVEFSRYSEEPESASSGWLLFQDIIFKPIAGALQFTARAAMFNIETYDARIYAYENDISGQFGIPAYSGRGYRTYLNIRFNGLRNIALEGRIARTLLPGEKSIGSGKNAIEGDRRTEAKLQVRFKF